MNSRSQKFLKKQPRQDRSKATVEAILEAATYILVNNGLEEFNTNFIAEKAGVSIASLYQYFVDKDAILGELQRRHVEKTRANTAKAVERYKEDGLEALVSQLIESSIAEHKTDPDLHRIFGRILVGTKANEVPSGNTFHLIGLKEVLKSHGVESNDVEFTVWLFRTIVHAAIHEGVFSYHEEIVSGRLATALNTMLIDWLTKKITASKNE